MNNLMEYRGYHAKIEYSHDDATFVGRVLGINDVIVFDGENVSELETIFHESIDDYLEMCAEMGTEPDKEYKGTFNVRISPELHKRAAIEAEKRDESLNHFVQQAIENELSGSHGRETVTIIMSDQMIKKYKPLHTGSGFSLDSFGKEEVLAPCYQSVKLQPFVS